MKNIPNYIGFKELVTEGTMPYKKAYKFTKKLNDDALLQDLIKITDKIHDKMGTDDVVNDWLWQVITYGNKHPQMWSESLDEGTMPYKKAYKFTKKLNDDKLLQDLIAVTDKIHDKMGTDDVVNDWLWQVITYGNKHPQMWSESLDEAAPKMTHHADVGFVADLISRLGGIGRRHTGAAIAKDTKKAIKALQSLKDSIKREANIPY